MGYAQYAIIRSLVFNEEASYMVKEVKCPWCGEVILKDRIKVKQYNSDYGPVIERRCDKCGKALAAYLEHEGNFLPRIRRF